MTTDDRIDLLSDRVRLLEQQVRFMQDAPAGDPAAPLLSAGYDWSLDRPVSPTTAPTQEQIDRFSSATFDWAADAGSEVTRR